MVFITLFMIGATAASAYMAAQQAKDQADFNKSQVDMNNTEALANYRRNLTKFSTARVEARKLQLTAQERISVQYMQALDQFEGDFTRGTGQSTHLFSQSIANLAGQDVEQVKQNLGRVLTGIDEQQEESRLDLRSQFQAPAPDQTNLVIASGVLQTGVAIASAPSQIRAQKAQESIRLAQARNLQSQGSLQLSPSRFQDIFGGQPFPVLSGNQNIG